ncbi:MAG: L-2-hydroxyglutarate oxidase [Thermoanaerobaculaceae bacterium]|nr:L-2-hydroxyglutarate oxidase [Thermoanaerobaculaceae bacterium]
MRELGECQVAVIGAGIVGLAVARSLAQRTRARIGVVEAEAAVAAHQSGHNSGVMHSGLYYAPGSLKAHNCTAGRQALERYCEDNAIPWRRCGKVVVATEPAQLPVLEELERRGRANGLVGIRRLAANEIAEFEPAARGVAGLWVGETGVVDYRTVAAAYARDVASFGGTVWLGSRLLGVRQRGRTTVLDTERGEVACEAVVNCAGLQSDRVARMCGHHPRVRIVPFRGEYYELAPAAAELVHGLIYPVPDPRFPFLGVHFTRRIAGEVEAGPNAVLAFKREGYRWTAVSVRDLASTLFFPGFWVLAGRYWKTGCGEVVRSWSKAAFARALQRLVPAVRQEDLRRGGAGVRAQALDASGRLLDDFCIVGGERQIHVLNAPSPAATASLAIGETVATMAIEAFSLPLRGRA